MPYLRRDTAELWWEAEGRGEPVLLIMGLGYPCDMWYRVLPALTSRFRAIRFDNRGAGRSGVPAGPYSIELMAQDAVAVLDAAGESSAHVVGISLGGVIAQALALDHPDRVRSLALISTHPGGKDAIPPEPGAMQMLTARSDMSPRDAAEAAIPFVYAAGTDRERIAEDIDVRMRRPTDPAGYTNQLRASLAYSGAFSRLPEIRVPTLVVHGTGDGLVPPANAPLVASRIPGARLVMLDGASHIVLTDRTDEVNALLVDFLDGVGPAGPARPG